MLRVTDLRVPLQADADAAALTAALKKLRLKADAVTEWHVARRSVDARDKGDVHFVYTVDVALKGSEKALLARLRPGTASLTLQTPPLCSRKAAPRMHAPVVVGMGPCGLFAALYLARAGLCPICLERGEPVERRQQTVATFFSGGKLDTESNVQFGEGGAGAFSDGKLNTGIKDPRCRQVLETLCEHGAPESILWQAHPHVGTDRLPQVVASIRREILSLGGQVLFGARLAELIIHDGRLAAIRFETAEGMQELSCAQLILAIGHSARDTFTMLDAFGVPMEQKPFSVGVRIEHRQQMIDRSQYGAAAGHEMLGAAEYRLHARLPDGRGVYSFCMCPGGQVIAAASEKGGVCTNGMSPYARDGMNANAALLVDVRTSDFPSEHPLAGISLQRTWEQAAFIAGGSDYKAPAQRVEDFMQGRISSGFGDVLPSYRPGVEKADLTPLLPAFAAQGLKAGIPLLARQLRGFDHPDAVLTGIEARSSSPVRIVRSETMQSAIGGLYPAGEGAGYAGGITSAAVDGLRVAQAVADTVL